MLCVCVRACVCVCVCICAMALNLFAHVWQWGFTTRFLRRGPAFLHSSFLSTLCSGVCLLGQGLCIPAPSSLELCFWCPIPFIAALLFSVNSLSWGGFAGPKLCVPPSWGLCFSSTGFYSLLPPHLLFIFYYSTGSFGCLCIRAMILHSECLS